MNYAKIVMKARDAFHVFYKTGIPLVINIIKLIKKSIQIAIK